MKLKLTSLLFFTFIFILFGFKNLNRTVDATENNDKFIYYFDVDTEDILNFNKLNKEIYQLKKEAEELKESENLTNEDIKKLDDIIDFTEKSLEKIVNNLITTNMSKEAKKNLSDYEIKLMCNDDIKLSRL